MALFPPIVASSMPAFDIDKNEVKIYFTLSNYNQLSDIKKVHISVRRQSSNVNVLINNQQVLEKDFYQDDVPREANEYYVLLKGTDLKEGFLEQVLYKVQLRLSQKTKTEEESYYEFFTNGIDFFSEWSTVCIIKPIKAPKFYIDEFYYEGIEEVKKDQDFSLNTSIADFLGVFKAEESSEILKSWRLRILKTYIQSNNINNISDEDILVDSTWKTISAYNYTSDSNNISFECHLPYQFNDSNQQKRYYLLFEIKTKNDFYDYKMYPFKYTNLNQDIIKDGELSTFINAEEGYIKVQLTSNEEKISNLVLRRSDSTSNFLKWQDLIIFEGIEKQYYDFTIESGIVYKYCVQKIDPYGRRGKPIKSQQSLIEFEHPFLLETAGNGDITKVKQLKLKYDFQISSFKTNILESKTDTLGSQYPYIRRNGDMYYRSFPITGTITAFMDDVNLFTKKDQLYPDQKKIKGYDQYYNNQYNYIYERQFREKVEEFLYNIKPKLYKSVQEGNILIKLMEVSLTPKQELNRLIYTFSATAYQIDKPSLENLELYDFIRVGQYNPNIRTPITSIGQLSSMNEDGSIKVYKGGEDIFGVNTTSNNSIAKKQKYNEPINGWVIDDFTIDYLKLTIESQPYLIIEENGVFRPYDDIDQDGKDSISILNPAKNKLYQIESTYTTSDINQYNNIYLGHLFSINGEQIIISSPNNIYELKDDGLQLPATTSVIPAKDTLMTVDYHIIKYESTDMSSIPKMIQNDVKIGQIIGKYNEDQNLVNEILNKYNVTYTDFKENVVKQHGKNVKSLNIDAEPGTVIKIKSYSSNENTTQAYEEQASRFVINHTGEFNFNPQNSQVNITSFQIYGINIQKNKCRDRNYIKTTDLLIDPNKQYYVLNQRNFEIVENPIIENIKNYYEYVFNYDINLITSPKHLDFYKDNNENKYYIYYKGQWQNADIINENEEEYSSFDIIYPMEAMILYTVQVESDYF